LSDAFVAFAPETESTSRGFRAVAGDGQGPSAFRSLGEDEPHPAPPPPPSPEELRTQLETRLRQEIEQEFQSRLATEDEHLQEIVQTLVATREQALDACAREASRLALAAAERIVRHELALDPTRLEGPLREGLARFADAKAVRVRLHPADAARLRANPALLEALGLDGLEEESSLQRGDCLVVAGDRAMDLRVESQSEEIQDAIDAVLGQE